MDKMERGGEGTEGGTVVSHIDDGVKLWRYRGNMSPVLFDKLFNVDIYFPRALFYELLS